MYYVEVGRGSKEGVTHEDFASLANGELWVLINQVRAQVAVRLGLDHLAGAPLGLAV